MTIIEATLKKFLEDIVFIEIKPDKKIKIGSLELDQNIPIPVLIENLADNIKVNDIEVIPTLAIVKGLIYVIGGESELKWESYYISLLKHIDIEIADKLLNDALNYAQIKEYNRAILYLNCVLKIEPENLDALYNQARCYEDLFSSTEEQLFMEQAAQLYKRTLEIDKSFGLGYYHLGIHAYNAGNYIEAEKIWKRALEFELGEDIREETVNFLSKCQDRALYEEGYEMILNGRVDEGLERLKSIEDEHGEWWNLNFFLGLGYKFKEEYEQALGYFLKVLTLNTGHVQTMNEVGICLLSLGDYDEALKYYKEALRLEPLNAEIICNMGIVYLNKGETAEGISKIDQAYKINSEDEVIALWKQHVDQNLR